MTINANDWASIKVDVSQSCAAVQCLTDRSYLRCCDSRYMTSTPVSLNGKENMQRCSVLKYKKKASRKLIPRETKGKRGRDD